jgi:hypothetical protein
MDEIGDAGVIPLLQRRGGRDLKKISPKASLNRSGRGGQEHF